MTPEQRIAESDDMACELRCEAQPWYTTSFRLRQWQACHEAYVFGWMTRELRRVGAPDIILEKLVDWEPVFERPN